MKVERRAPGPASAWLRRCLRQTEGYLSHLFPTGMIRGGPDRAKVLKRTPSRGLITACEWRGACPKILQAV
jgi:hypothetical protein